MYISVLEVHMKVSRAWNAIIPMNTRLKSILSYWFENIFVKNVVKDISQILSASQDRWEPNLIDLVGNPDAAATSRSALVWNTGNNISFFLSWITVFFELSFTPVFHCNPVSTIWDSHPLFPTSSSTHSHYSYSFSLLLSMNIVSSFSSSSNIFQSFLTSHTKL